MPREERRRLLFQASASSMLSVILYRMMAAACQSLLGSCPTVRNEQAAYVSRLVNHGISDNRYSMLSWIVCRHSFHVVIPPPASGLHLL